MHRRETIRIYAKGRSAITPVRNAQQPGFGGDPNPGCVHHTIAELSIS